MKNYLTGLTKLLKSGWDEDDGVEARATIGGQLTFDLAGGFPILTSRTIDFDAAVNLALRILAVTDYQSFVSNPDRYRGNVGDVTFNLGDDAPDSIPNLVKITPVINGFYIHYAVSIPRADYVRELPIWISALGLICTLISRNVGMGPGQLVLSLGRTYVLKKDVNQIMAQLNRPTFKLPHLEFKNEELDISKLSTSDIGLSGYVHGDPITYK